MLEARFREDPLNTSSTIILETWHLHTDTGGGETENGVETKCLKFWTALPAAY